VASVHSTLPRTVNADTFKFDSIRSVIPAGITHAYPSLIPHCCETRDDDTVEDDEVTMRSGRICPDEVELVRHSASKADGADSRAEYESEINSLNLDIYNCSSSLRKCAEPVGM